MSEGSKKVDIGLQRQNGLDLRFDKKPIIKSEFAAARREGRIVPKTSSAQVHAHEWSWSLVKAEVVQTQRKADPSHLSCQENPYCVQS